MLKLVLISSVLDCLADQIRTREIFLKSRIKNVLQIYKEVIFFALLK